ncbi:alpha/beta fold hydrolase (plasmid) [Novosphingobium aerophilum]|jgi:sigma-B regulation protein RsbQ|uniref:alpha/beta fold hydrolase n=1 Tax=Novosphingobium aerophilum TaxID=2839843 RepID=UPI003FD0EBC7
MSVLQRNNVTVSGSGRRTIVFAHGFGCDQQAWKDVIPAFSTEYRTVAFDHVGAGQSDRSAFDPEKYSSLHGYKRDILEVLDALDLSDVIFAGHSVAGMMGMLAAIEQPDRFASLIMVCPSPCYVDEPGYKGGFSRQDLDELLEVIDSNFLGWARDGSRAIMGNPDRPELGSDLGESFCRTDPSIAAHFARVTFLSDHRSDLPKCETRTLVLQTMSDMVAPEEVGQYVAARMPNAQLHIMAATGHCPHMSAPAETIEAMRQFLDS